MVIESAAIISLYITQRFQTIIHSRELSHGDRRQDTTVYAVGGNHSTIATFRLIFQDK